MRGNTWRTAVGAFYQVNTNVSYRTCGHGKVTLWPAPLDATGFDAVYPRSFSGPVGTVTALFDTAFKEQSGAMVKLSTTIRIRNADLRWIVSNGSRCGLRWPYSGDAQDYVTNTIRIVAERCVADQCVSGSLPKKLAGDGMSCGKNYDWGF